MNDLLILLSAFLIGFVVIMPLVWWSAHTRGWRRGYAAGRMDVLAEQQMQLFRHDLTSVNTLGGEYTREEIQHEQ